ncbi:MAG: glycosyltransferase, partial [Spirochaetaceae bacterium]|nr:glycosyltransferase [Spirochaetaceae bacterium]
MSDIAVGLFIDSYVPIIDGVTVTVRNYAYWLNRTLGPACVVAPSAPSHRDAEGFPVLRFLSIPTFVHPPYRIGLPSIDGRLARALESHSFSLFHAHSPFGAGRAALRAARAARRPIVATFHSKFRDNLRQAIPFCRLVDDQVRRIVDFFESVDRVWIPQESVALTMREYGYRGTYEVVENGIDFAPPEDAAPFAERGGRLLGLPDGAPVGLYVGQHILEKNLEFLMRSLPLVMKAFPDFRMIFVGDGCARPRLRRLAAELGLEGRASFLGPISDRGALAAIYARAELFLFPSLFDNAPLVVREAAAFGTPSVLLRGSTAAEVVRDAENGFLAEAGEEAFAERVIQVLGDRPALERAGLGAR